MLWYCEAMDGAAAWISASVSDPSPSTSACVQWCVELNALSLLFAAPDVDAVSEVSDPMVELLELGLVLVALGSVDVVDEEVVLWSASMLPVELVPVAVSASGAEVVVSGRAVSVCDVAEDEE